MVYRGSDFGQYPDQEYLGAARWTFRGWAVAGVLVAGIVGGGFGCCVLGGFRGGCWFLGFLFFFLFVFVGHNDPFKNDYILNKHALWYLILLYPTLLTDTLQGMLPYTVNRASRVNMAALKSSGWRILITPDKPVPPAGMHFAIDNGAWTMRNDPPPHDFSRFAELVERFGCAADFVILPDVWGQGAESFELSRSWIPRLRNLQTILFPIQDGMTPESIGNILREHRNIGLFLGGTDARDIYAWGAVARSWRRWYHVGRVNSVRRIRLCAEAGATSFDGSSAACFADKLARLDHPRKQPSLLAPDGRDLGPVFVP